MSTLPFNLKVFSLEVIHCIKFSKDFELLERRWFSMKLNFQWLSAIQVNVCISQSVYKVTWLQVCDECNHVDKQGVAGNVEWHS